VNYNILATTKDKLGSDVPSKIVDFSNVRSIQLFVLLYNVFRVLNPTKIAYVPILLNDIHCYGRVLKRELITFTFYKNVREERIQRLDSFEFKLFRSRGLIYIMFTSHSDRVRNKNAIFTGQANANNNATGFDFVNIKSKTFREIHTRFQTKIDHTAIHFSNRV